MQKKNTHFVVACAWIPHVRTRFLFSSLCVQNRRTMTVRKLWNKTRHEQNNQNNFSQNFQKGENKQQKKENDFSQRNRHKHFSFTVVFMWRSYSNMQYTTVKTPCARMLSDPQIWYLIMFHQCKTHAPKAHITPELMLFFFLFKLSTQ